MTFFRSAPRSFDAAARDLGDGRPAVRLAAVHDVVRHAEDHRAQVVTHLVGLLGEAEPNRAVRAAAAFGLGDLRAAEAVPALLRAGHDDDDEVRQAVLCALGEVGDERAEPLCSAALGDPAPAVRFQAVMAYARVCPERERAVAALVHATEDEDPEICHLGLRMAEELGPDPGQESSVVAPALLARARALLEHVSPTVRLASAIIVARSGEADGDEQLCAAVEGRLVTSQGDDEAAAIELCGERRLRAATAALERRAFGSRLSLRQDPFAWQARVALLQLGHPRALGWVLGDLRSLSRERRTLAIAAAGRGKVEAARGLLEQLKGRAPAAEAEAVQEALAALGELGPK
jgi:HEAT repeat protein